MSYRIIDRRHVLKSDFLSRNLDPIFIYDEKF